ncbi:enhanced serine sensitivity protein SseB C-terminal domain-containing protein [Streptomyces sp. SL13]|uniref:Enhanced serine sensitivity protein SseB C-terminal domain-containing protein n=1 Tax=Streptantibioticus silvisoli TaxID=2705255 RepID=A0AA90KF14_9ACTN|nr:enhanced serine sensitivity protein SseB C-terminal domain-containing protein [Streptantibioticus silvisoli]MDI5962782.1 enhanced serine sensitivity protein SseB C-terminal domain-containing protein [Streptantibioticus silvisoli]MDI5968399.1 enhanced serine sensitivity protein SseB C-terminal domain-containing protein [Streptantibioticus silvisoli]
MNAGVEDALRQVAPGRYDTYEVLLHALSEGQVWMLLWHGQPGSPDAQYGNMELDGLGYAPCVTSTQELLASGWNRSHEIVTGRDIAAELYRERYGLWLNPHAPGGGVGVPWLDLRRTATGLDRLPAGPLHIGEPDGGAQQFYAPLGQYAQSTPVVRALRGAWVRPALGDPYLAVGLDLYDNGPQAVEAVRLMMQQAVAGAPAGLAVSTVAMADEYDQVALWMRHCARPFYDRDLFGATQAMPAPATGAWGGQPTAYGAPPQQGWAPPRPY